MANLQTSEPLVLVSKQNGIVVIPANAELTRLNYFDGKFLRASDLKTEQDYLRKLVALSNQAGGAGVAHGYDLRLGAGDTLTVGPGLALDYQGRVLLLPQEISFSISKLIEQSQAVEQLMLAKNAAANGEFAACEMVTDAPPVDALPTDGLYVIVLTHAEAWCGQEDVFGKLCEEACATSTDRPYILEGVTVRAVPLTLKAPLPSWKGLTQKHLRSVVAHRYFADERQRVADQISGPGLRDDVWCFGAAPENDVFNGVPIGVLSRAGATTRFLDAWIARRERIDTPAKRYWQWRMRMRPWDVFLAQILQFQCQLHDLLTKHPLPTGGDDACQGARDSITDAVRLITDVRSFYASRDDEPSTLPPFHSQIVPLFDKLQKVQQALAATVQERMLINGGIIELPSAGYLPVSTEATINQQVRRMMGEGVDLRFCRVTSDYVAHALEEAQHMERISLIEGLEDPTKKPPVDILVPEGEILNQQRLSPGRGFEAAVLFPAQNYTFRGAARLESLSSGGGAAYLSAFAEFLPRSLKNVPTEGTDTPRGPFNLRDVMHFEEADHPEATTVLRTRAGAWVQLRCEHDVFTLGRSDTTNFNARAIVATTASNESSEDMVFNGVLVITEPTTTQGTKKIVKGRITDAPLSFPGSLKPRPPILIDLNVTITLTNGEAIEILLDHADNDLMLVADWSGQPLTVKAQIRSKTKARGDDGQLKEETLVETDLKENADVLSDKNANHLLAVTALDLIESVMKNGDFVDKAKRLLFPPPLPPTDELIVRGTKNWVLFHRRRTKVCSEEKLAQPPLPSRRYRVFHLRAQSEGEAKELIVLIRRGAVPANRLSSAGEVEYVGGAATLVTTRETLRQNWQGQPQKPGNMLMYGLIASHGAAVSDGEMLTRLRLDRFEEAIADISNPGAQIVEDYQDRLPAPFTGVDVDGVIILLTLEQVEKVCHTVYAVFGPQQMKIVESMIAQSVSDAIGQSGAVLLGEVNFKAGTTDVLDDSLGKVRQSLLEKSIPLRQLFVVTQASQSLPAVVDQGATIGKGVSPTGITLSPPKLFTVNTAFPPDVKCPVITFIEVNPKP